MKLMKLILLQAKISIKQFFIYKTASILTLLFGTLSLLAQYLAIDVYFSFSANLGSLSKFEFFILFGSFNLMVYLYNFFFEIGHDEFALKVKYGELDYTLLRPCDAMVLTSFSRFDYPSLLNMVLPFLFVVKGFEGANIHLSLIESLSFCIAIFLGAFVIYLLNHLVIVLNFWFHDFSNGLLLVNSIVDLGAKPMSFYPFFIQTVFGFCIPIILACNLPFDIALHKISFFKVLSLFLSVSILFLFSRVVWILGLKKYASAS